MKTAAASWPILRGKTRSAGASALLFPLLFSWSLRPDCQRVHSISQFRRQRRIYHAVALDPALPFEGRRHNIDPKMRLAARPVAGVALMQMGFVGDVEVFRRESFTQLVYDSVSGSHDGGITSGPVFRQWDTGITRGIAMSRLEAFCIA